MPPGISKLPPGASKPSTGNDHLTSPSLLCALGALKRRGEEYVLGSDPYHVDFCASRRQPWPTARFMFTEDEDGLAQDWSQYGECFLNCPYGTQMAAWVARLAAHGNGTALLYARTDTNAFHNHVWAKCDAVYYFRQRLFFHAPVTGIQYSANCGGPMLLAIYGQKSLERVKRLLAPTSGYPGSLVPVSRKLVREVRVWGERKGKEKARRKPQTGKPEAA
jgi:hypothetical protein